MQGKLDIERKDGERKLTEQVRSSSRGGTAGRQSGGADSEPERGPAGGPQRFRRSRCRKHRNRQERVENGHWREEKRRCGGKSEDFEGGHSVRNAEWPGGKLPKISKSRWAEVAGLDSPPQCGKKTASGAEEEAEKERILSPTEERARDAWDDIRSLLQGGKRGLVEKRRCKADVPNQIEVCSWNTGGLPGIWRILELLETTAWTFDVLRVQELNANDEDVHVCWKTHLQRKDSMRTCSKAIQVEQ